MYIQFHVTHRLRLNEAIAKHGRLHPITDHGSVIQTNLNTRDDTSEFEKELANGINHITLTKVNHVYKLKIELFHCEIQKKQKWFKSIQVLLLVTIQTTHVSLDWDNQKTPSKAFVKRCQKKESTSIINKRRKISCKVKDELVLG